MTFAPTDTSHRRAIHRRCGEACAYCGTPYPFHSPKWEIEHIDARANGGGNQRENLVVACREPCNRLKAGNGPEFLRDAIKRLITGLLKQVLGLLTGFARDPHSESVRDLVELALLRWEAGGQVGFAREDLLRQGEVRE